ncbi:HAMP domain-containing sensor histidine kinase [Micromonospora sp. NPDC049559]|uniref:sensor histidine kinase n=1 Tax=Micromonospora sp. NPDC049559 TaxID=3155923 RepID=UPI00343D1219
MRRRSLRTQLTLLYVVPFLLSGAALVAIPLSQTRLSVSAGAGGGGGPSALAPGPGLEPLLRAATVGLAATLVVAVVVGWLVAGRFLRPLRTITATARDISATNLHRRLGRTGRRDEFAVLAETLDDLFGRLKAAFESQRRFVANASHELRTPLTAERTLLQVALADPEADADSLRAACREVLALNRAQARLVDALLTLAGGERGVERREPLDLAGVAAAVVRAREPEARRRGVRVWTALDPAPTAGDPSLVASLVANLVENALRHNAPDGRVEVATSTVGGRARLAVRNTGPVIPPERVDRLLQPFERLVDQRAHADGHGLGLAIVRAIAHAHGAALRPRARPEGGLEIEVDFP